MQIFSKTLTVLFGLALLGAIGLGTYWALQWVAELFSRLDSQVAAVTAIASMVTLLAATIVASRIGRATRQNQANMFFTEKAAAYDLFIDLWGSLLLAEHDTDDRSPQQVADELSTLDRQLILYGSSGIVKAHVVLRTLWREGKLSQPNGWYEFVEALMKIRQDLGLSQPGLTIEDLRQLLLPKTNTPGSPTAFTDPQINGAPVPKA
ncbi:MAG: hypothetical protein U1F76_06945 [Candidatus Competibacteraceae bacterium]